MSHERLEQHSEAYYRDRCATAVAEQSNYLLASYNSMPREWQDYVARNEIETLREQVVANYQGPPSEAARTLSVNASLDVLQTGFVLVNEIYALQAEFPELDVQGILAERGRRIADATPLAVIAATID